MGPGRRPSDVSDRAVTHQYKRRTMDEAQELARLRFRSEAAAHLTAEEIDEVGRHALLTSGDPSEGWEAHVGFRPDIHGYYQFEIYKPADEHPYVEKVYARILVGRDRADEFCAILWRPPISRGRDG